MHSCVLFPPQIKNMGPSIQIVVKAASQRSTSLVIVPHVKRSWQITLICKVLLIIVSCKTTHVLLLTFHLLTTEQLAWSVKVDFFKFPADWRITGTYFPIERVVFLSHLFPSHIVSQALEAHLSSSNFSLLIKNGTGCPEWCIKLSRDPATPGLPLKHSACANGRPDPTFSSRHHNSNYGSPNILLYLTGFLLVWKYKPMQEFKICLLLECSQCNHKERYHIYKWISKPLWQVNKHLVKQILAPAGRTLPTFFPFVFASEDSRTCSLLNLIC